MGSLGLDGDLLVVQIVRLLGVKAFSIGSSALNIVLLISEADVLHEENEDRRDDSDHSCRNEDDLHCVCAAGARQYAGT